METIDEEEIKEQLKEEMAKFEDDGYFRRLIKMFVGLGRPRNSPSSYSARPRPCWRSCCRFCLSRRCSW